MLQTALQKVLQMKVINHVPWSLGMAKKEWDGVAQDETEHTRA